MADLNTLTGCIPSIFAARDEVSRELVGMIPAVRIDATSEQAALNQTVTVRQYPSIAASTAVTPGAYAPDSGGRTINPVTMSITKVQMIPIQFTHEERKSIEAGYDDILKDAFSQAFRTLGNEVEYDLTTAAYQNASRGYGTPGTNPFASSNAILAQMGKILDDNGAPGKNVPGMRTIVMNTAAGAAFRSLANNISAYAAGTDATLRQGTLLNTLGFDLKESAQIRNHTKGTMTGAQIAAAGEAAGQTTLSLDGSDSGTVLKGDLIKFGTGGGAGTGTDYDTLYALQDATHTLSGAASGNIVIGAPGLLVARVDNDEATLAANYTANLAFSRNAIVLMARAPAQLPSGKSNVQVMFVQDPVTGIIFEVSMYDQYRQSHIEVALAWGVKVIKPEHVAIMVG
ncbi:MAG TPA: hypothetical protein PL173_12005 [Saprospiraceae bacterium]|nr:hypothetical protein [Saprospiraceae bacterium]